jgi:hypothetical protein
MADSYKSYKVVYRCPDPRYIMLYDTYFFDDVQKMTETIKKDLMSVNSDVTAYIYVNPVTPTLLCSIGTFKNSTLAEVRKGGSPLASKLISIKDIDENLFCMEDNELQEKPTTNYDLTDDGKGKKYDTGKPMVGALCRVFPRALLSIGKCIEFGTHKYPKPDNWKLVEGAYTRYQDSLMRHYLKFLAGEMRDSETNLLHLAHMAWNCLAVLELYLMEHKEEFDGELFN